MNWLTRFLFQEVTPVRHPGAIKITYVPAHGDEEVIAVIRADEHAVIKIDVREPQQSLPATEVQFTFGAPSPK
jgi:hypothetical protein